MRKVILCFSVVIIAIFITGCGNKSSAPENVRDDLWVHGIQFGLFMKDTIHGGLEQNDYEKFESAFNIYHEKFDKDATEEERVILLSLYTTKVIYDIAKMHRETLGDYGYDDEVIYNEIFDNLESDTFGSSNFNDENYDKSVMKKIFSKYKVEQ